MKPLSLSSKDLSATNQYRQAYNFYSNFQFTNCQLDTVADIETPENDDVISIDGNSEITGIEAIDIDDDLILSEAFSIRNCRFFPQCCKDMLEPLNSPQLPYITKAMLMLLMFPLSVLFMIKKIRTYIVIAVFNYTGINLRTTLFLNISTERDDMIRTEYFQCKPITFDKVSFLAERYITYWIVVLLLITAAPFINKTDLFDIINGYDFIQNNSNWDYFYHIGISFALAFANLIPKRSVRPDLSSFVSSFTGEDYSIRDSAHTRLKDLSEILCDIKLHGFALLSTDIYTPIIVSTMPPEELRIMPGFTALLSTDTFANNQILRFIQVEKDVDTFFVLRNDIGMCHHIEYDPTELQDVTMSLLSGSVGHIDISDQDLSLYGSAFFVFLVGLFVTEASINVVAALSSWVAWPLLAVLLFRRRRSKLASINFFTLDGKDRKYQPFNNICVCSDDLILSKIRSFTFFCALTKFTPQKNYLVHTLLKVVEGLQYCWLERGLTVRDFKRLAELAAVTYEQDVAVITPNARVYYSAPRRLSEHCVVCVVNTKGEVNSECMTHAQFLQVSDSLPYGQDTQRVELMLLK